MNYYALNYHYFKKLKNSAFSVSLWLMLTSQTKKTRTFLFGFFGIKAWRCPTLTWGDPTLPSALSSFTSEFEMGSGGSYLLLPPDKLVEEHSDETIPRLSRDLMNISRTLLKLESQISKYILVLHSNKHLCVSLCKLQQKHLGLYGQALRSISTG